MAASFDIIRKGNSYRLVNFGETNEFKVVDIESADNIKVKDLLTLEVYFLDDLIKFGIGKDYDFCEIE